MRSSSPTTTSNWSYFNTKTVKDMITNFTSSSYRWDVQALHKKNLHKSAKKVKWFAQNLEILKKNTVKRLRVMMTEKRKFITFSESLCSKSFPNKNFSTMYFDYFIFVCQYVMLLEKTCLLTFQVGVPSRISLRTFSASKSVHVLTNEMPFIHYFNGGKLSN